MSSKSSKVDWKNKEAVRGAVAKDGHLLRKPRRTLKRTKESLIAVTKNGPALQHADLTGILRGNRKIVFAACNEDGESLQFVASDLRNVAREVVRVACATNGDALRFAGEKFKKDPAMVRHAMESWPLAFEHAPLESVWREGVFYETGLRADKVGACLIQMRSIP